LDAPVMVTGVLSGRDGVVQPLVWVLLPVDEQWAA
jgi:hypothetical protein